jgi:hypothetical protein
MPAHRPLIVCSSPDHRLLIARSSSAHRPLVVFSSPARRLLVARLSSAHRPLVVCSPPACRLLTARSSSAHCHSLPRSLPARYQTTNYRLLIGFPPDTLTTESAEHEIGARRRPIRCFSRAHVDVVRWLGLVGRPTLYTRVTGLAGLYGLDKCCGFIRSLSEYVKNAITITAVIVCTFVSSLLLQTPTNLPFSRLGHCYGRCSLLRHILVCKNEPEVDFFRHLMLPTPLHLPWMQEQNCQPRWIFSTLDATITSPPPPCAKPSLRWIIFAI